MMAMLRYIDDLRLETTATLLYCVRTNKDIIFESELAQLRSRLKNFEYHVLLSQPHAEWSGPRGHVSREFIENTVSDIELPHFFLCGPPRFMDASRAILIGLGVKPERIMQESFGSSAFRSAQPVSAAAEDGCGDRVRSIRARHTPSAAARPCWRRPRSTELAYLHPAGRDSVEPARRSCWQEMCKWTPKRDSIPIRERKASC
jgi:ferredoxin-NADP reductase